MSAYKKIECDFVDKDILLKALSLLGFEAVIHDEPVHLKDYMGKQRPEKATIVVS